MSNAGRRLRADTTSILLAVLWAGASGCTADFDSLFGPDGGRKDATADITAEAADAAEARGDADAGMGTPDTSAPDMGAQGVDGACPNKSKPVECSHISMGPGCCTTWEGCDKQNGCCLEEGPLPSGEQACGQFGGDFPLPQCCSGLVCTTGGSCEKTCGKLGDPCSTTNDQCCNQVGSGGGGSKYYCASSNKCAACLKQGVACTSDSECCYGSCHTRDGGKVCSGGGG